MSESEAGAGVQRVIGDITARLRYVEGDIKEMRDSLEGLRSELRTAREESRKTNDEFIKVMAQAAGGMTVLKVLFGTSILSVALAAAGIVTAVKGWMNFGN